MRNSKTPSKSELSIFCSQLSLFLRSGISISEGLLMLLEDLDRGRLKSAVEKISASMGEGLTLTQSVEQSGAFPEYFIKMLAVGEISGALESIFSQLSTYYDREAELKKRIRNAVAYPLVLLVLMTAVFAVLLVRVLPMFSDILRSLGSGLPPFVQSLMNLGGWLSANFLYLVLGLLIFIVLVRLFFSTARGMRFKHTMAARLPGLRGLNEKIAAERFSLAMSALLSSGVDVARAFEMSRDLLGNSWYAGQIDLCVEKSRQSGKSLYESLIDMKLFPGLFGRMLAIGVKAGDVDGVFRDLAAIYRGQSDNWLKRMTGLIEPICVGILSLAVGAILISVMLPLISIMSSIS